jgi:hypothetical protein
VFRPNIACVLRLPVRVVVDIDTTTSTTNINYGDIHSSRRRGRGEERSSGSFAWLLMSHLNLFAIPL